MSGEAWLYLFAVIINAVNLFLQVFFTIMYSDLEWYVTHFLRSPLFLQLHIGEDSCPHGKLRSLPRLQLVLRQTDFCLEAELLPTLKAKK